MRRRMAKHLCSEEGLVETLWEQLVDAFAVRYERCVRACVCVA